MSGGAMSLLCAGGTEVLNNVNTYSARAPALRHAILDMADQLAQVAALAQADFPERVPDFGLQPHGGAAASGRYVPIDKSTSTHEPLRHTPTHTNPCSFYIVYLIGCVAVFRPGG